MNRKGIDSRMSTPRQSSRYHISWSEVGHSWWSRTRTNDISVRLSICVPDEVAAHCPHTWLLRLSKTIWMFHVIAMRWLHPSSRYSVLRMSLNGYAPGKPRTVSTKILRFIMLSQNRYRYSESIWIRMGIFWWFFFCIEDGWRFRNFIWFWYTLKGKIHLSFFCSIKCHGETINVFVALSKVLSGKLESVKLHS